MKKLFPILFISLVVVAFVLGALPAFHQYEVNAAYRPVPAIIDASDIKKHDVSGERDDKLLYVYEPVVEYRFRVHGKITYASRVFSFSRTGTYEWANKVKDSYRPGDETTAYYNPDNPVRSFLIKHYRFTPYLYIFIPIVIISVLLVVWLYVPRVVMTGKPNPPKKEEDGMFRVAPFTGLAENWWHYLKLLLLWAAPGIAFTGHYFIAAPGPYESIAYWTAAIFILLLLVLLAIFSFYEWLRRHITEAVFYTSCADYRLGDRVKVEVRQEFIKPFKVEKAMIGMNAYNVATPRDVKEIKNPLVTGLFQEWVTLVELHPVTVGTTLRLNAELEIPTDVPATKPPGSDENDFPIYRWCFHYRLYLAGKGKLFYGNKYPVVVQEESGALL
jgi:hypothetical protein